MSTKPPTIGLRRAHRYALNVALALVMFCKVVPVSAQAIAVSRELTIYGDPASSPPTTTGIIALSREFTLYGEPAVIIPTDGIVALSREFTHDGKPCLADRDDGVGDGRADGGVTIDDLLFFLICYAAGVTCADVDNGLGGGRPDGGVTIDDLLYFLQRYAAGC